MSKRIACEVCGYYTLFRNSAEHSEVCPVCYWEDDPLHAKDHRCQGSCNGQTMEEAQTNYSKVGACCIAELPYVRFPLAEEFPENQKPQKRIRRTLGFFVLTGMLVSSVLIQSRFFFGIAALFSVVQGFRIWRQKVER